MQHESCSESLVVRMWCRLWPGCSCWKQTHEKDGDGCWEEMRNQKVYIHEPAGWRWEEEGSKGCLLRPTKEVFSSESFLLIFFSRVFKHSFFMNHDSCSSTGSWIILDRRIITFLQHLILQSLVRSDGASGRWIQCSFFLPFCSFFSTFSLLPWLMMARWYQRWFRSCSTSQSVPNQQQADPINWERVQHSFHSFRFSYFFGRHQNIAPFESSAGTKVRILRMSCWSSSSSSCAIPWNLVKTKGTRRRELVKSFMQCFGSVCLDQHEEDDATMMVGCGAAGVNGSQPDDRWLFVCRHGCRRFPDNAMDPSIHSRAGVTSFLIPMLGTSLLAGSFKYCTFPLQLFPPQLDLAPVKKKCSRRRRRGKYHKRGHDSTDWL